MDGKQVSHPQHSTKVQAALERRLPVLSLAYLQACVDAGRPVPSDDFRVPLVEAKRSLSQPGGLYLAQASFGEFLGKGSHPQGFRGETQRSTPGSYVSTLFQLHSTLCTHGFYLIK